MRYYSIFLAVSLILLAVLTGCGNSEEFLIKCEIKGLGNKGVEMFYVDRDLRRVSFHPVDDKVTLRGVSQEPTLVEVFTVDGDPLFSCVAANGDELEVKMLLADPTSVRIKGNDDSKRYAEFLVVNDSVLTKGDAAAVNSLIAKEVRSNPSAISSAMLIATRFQARGYELLADSLINALTPDARPEGDRRFCRTSRRTADAGCEGRPAQHDFPRGPRHGNPFRPLDAELQSARFRRAQQARQHPPDPARISEDSRQEAFP